MLEAHRPYRHPVHHRPDDRLRVGPGVELEPRLLSRVLAAAHPRQLGQRHRAVALVLDHHGVPPVAGPDVGHDAVEHRQAAVYQADRLAEGLDLLHEVRREDHRRAALALLEDEVLQEARVDGVEAGEGLVEDDEVGLVDDRRRELHLLLHALRQVAGVGLRVGGEADAFEPRVRAPRRLGLVEPANGGEERQLLGHLHLGVEAALLRQVPDPVPHRQRVARAEQLDVSAVGDVQAQAGPDGRGLAGAVGPEQPEDRAGRHAEVQAADRRGSREGLDQVLTA